VHFRKQQDLRVSPYKLFVFHTEQVFLIYFHLAWKHPKKAFTNSMNKVFVKNAAIVDDFNVMYKEIAFWRQVDDVASTKFYAKAETRFFKSPFRVLASFSRH
jgi:hypothetical protein